MRPASPCPLRCLLAAALATASITSTALEATHRVHVTVIRRESSLHTSTGNRDAYLIRITPANGKPFDARMIDRYPSYADGLPVSYIGNDAHISVELRRTPSCDQPAAESVALTNQQDDTHCFALVHGSWKAPKGSAVDEWWK